MSCFVGCAECEACNCLPAAQPDASEELFLCNNRTQIEEGKIPGANT